jgi:STE24 endopeptidase
LRLGATAIAALIVAEGAAWLLRPKDVVEPEEVDEHAYFSDREIERAEDYRSGQRLLLVGGLAAQGTLLVVLVAGRPGAARRLLDKAGERPVLGGAAVAAGLFGAAAVVALPFEVAAHERAVDVGLSTQDLGEWGGDWLKSTAISVVIAAGVGTGALALIRRLGARWWIPGSAAVLGIAALFSWLAPVVLAPLFNDFEKLPPGPARTDVLELADEAGVDVGEVYKVDASRRSTSLNAFVSGLGHTKRVVLYDNLLEDANRPELRSVVAHELGHVKGRDIGRGLLFVAISTPLALLFGYGLATALGRRSDVEPGSPAFLPALALSLAVTSFAVGVAGNQLSRGIEAKADTTALELTDDPQALIDLQVKLAETNVSDPDPPGVFQFLLGSHPTTVERIGEAEAWRAGERP